MLFTRLFSIQSNNNATQTALHLVKKLHIPVTPSSVIKSVEHSPHYPSLLSISDSLKSWKVENIALEVQPEKLDSLPVPFVAHTKKGDGNFQLITSVNGAVGYINSKGKEQSKTREEFLGEWNGVVLLAEATNASGEKNYKKQRAKDRFENVRIPVILLSCVLLNVAFFFSTFQPGNFSTIAPNLLIFLKITGCIITGLLLWFEIDRSNPVLKEICSGGKKTNCEAVLNSKSSRLFSWISWSEVGFFYFAGGFIFLLSSVNNQQSTFSALSWLNLLALPYTLFSIYYQWRIAKQWCPLCLAVQGLLVAEAIVFYFSYWKVSTLHPFNFSTLIAAATSFALPVFFWVFTKPFLLKAATAQRLEKELARLKYNPEIFNELLSKQNKVNEPTDGLGIVIGNPNATNTIIKVCNPYCGPCAKAHAVIHEILENNEDVKVQIIFTATDDEKDYRAKPVKHLLALYAKGDKHLTEKALNDWYGAENKDYDLFAGKYKLNGELQNQGNKLNAMDAWCKEIGIEATPTFFVNGHRLPEVYKVEDLKYLL